MKKNKIKSIIFFAVLLPAILQAQTTATWTGSADTDWNNPSNWNWSLGSGIPTDSTEVTIPANCVRWPVIGNTTKARKVTIELNAELDLKNYKITTYSNNTELNNSGTLKLQGTDSQKIWLNNSLTLNPGSTIEYTSNTSNIYTGEYYNLKISTNGSISIQNDDITIKESLINDGTFNAENRDITLSAYRPEITVKGNNSEAKTKIGRLIMESAGGKTLKLDGKIEIKTTLKLSGTEGEKKFLKIEGGNSHSEITLTGNGEGDFLEIDTDKVKITGSNNFTAKNSKQKDGKRPDNETPVSGWKFSPVNLEWTGSDSSEPTKWENPKNWDLGAVPSQQDNVKISNTIFNNNWPKLTNSSNAKAKKITLESGSYLDLGGQTISAASGKSEMDISGTLKLEYTSDQKNWFKQSPNKVTLKEGSTVEINGSGNLELHDAETYNGGFKNLTINRSGDTTVTSEAETINVGKEFKVIQQVTLNKKLKAANLNIYYGALTSADNSITITEKLNNLGTFTSTGDVILEPSSSTITVTGSTDQNKTSFRNLTCSNQGGKTLHFSNKIKVTGNLTLSGSSSNKLTVYGSNNAAVYLEQSQNDKGEYLKVNTESIKINEGDFAKYYKLKDSEDNDGKQINKNGWVFVDNFEFKNSFMRVNGNELYIVFRRDTEENEFTHSTLKIKNNSTEITSSSTSQLPVKYKTISGPLAVWKYTLDKNISADEILQKEMKIEIQHFNKTYNKDNISDVGIGLTNVLFAANSRTIRDFSGEKDLPKLNTMIVTALAGTSNNVKLYLSVDESGFWYPPSAQVPADGIIGARKIGGFSDYSGESEGGKIKFTVVDTDSNFKEGGTAQFMFLYDGWLPCARLKNPSDILSFDVWKFVVIGVRHQRGGVSIFNNVINPDKGEKASIQIFVQKKGTLTIQVMTLDGNIVKTLERSQKSGGTHFYYWDGKNNSGVSVARGMYFIRIAGPDIDETRKVMITRD
ncbi:FlgD immunoglobulin-like domain containing protein [Treponema pedis]|uniref:FlgD immunoglobulin-like domain containing protein n=1 Tax=Treponema pedis TaxID=409322 RepID=UPI000424FEE0|nr:FlgD immunoglobulin-like domain containing protein [Treponema pedis]